MTVGAMFICAAGDIHGALDQLYCDVLAFEESLGVRFDHVLHVGDFGIWPDPKRIDKATRKHEGAGDFPVWFAEGRAAPRPTIRCIGLNKVGMPGNLVALDMPARGRDCEILAEWPSHR